MFLNYKGRCEILFSKLVSPPFPYSQASCVVMKQATELIENPRKKRARNFSERYDSRVEVFRPVEYQRNEKGDARYERGVTRILVDSDFQIFLWRAFSRLQRRENCRKGFHFPPESIIVYVLLAMASTHFEWLSNCL